MRRRLLLSLLVTCNGASGPAAPTAVSAQAWPEADALFHSDPRWLGADGAYSIDLGAGRVLWLFGDTFVATSPANVRSESTMVRNTVAIQAGYDPSQASMVFRWGNSGGVPSSFFASSGTEWFWPGHGALVNGCLLIFLSRIAPSSGGLGFQAAGWNAVCVKNPTADPSLWTPISIPVPSTPGVTFGEAAVVADGRLYVFGAEDQSHAVHLVRWPISAVDAGDLSVPGPEWWTPSGWVASASLTSLPAPLFADGATELSVQADQRDTEWLEVQTVGFGAATLDLRAGSYLVGPWGSLAAVYTPPESSRADVLVYAGKGHPELTGAQLVATYASNSTSFTTLVADTTLYYPRFVRLNW